MCHLLQNSFFQRLRFSWGAQIHYCSWYARCIAHHPGTDMIKLQRIRLNHKVTGALWERKGDLWQSHFCRLLKPVILFKGQPLIWQVWVSVRKEGQSSYAQGGACAEKLRRERLQLVAKAGNRTGRWGGGAARHKWNKIRASLRDCWKTTLPLPSFLLSSRSALSILWPTASCSLPASSQSGEGRGGRWDMAERKVHTT